MRALLITGALSALLIAGCGDAPATTANNASLYQTGTSASSGVIPSGTGSYGGSTGSYPGSAGVFTGNPSTAGTFSATESTSPATDPQAGTGISATVTASTPKGLFHRTLQLSVQVVNHDPQAHDGWIIATFTSSKGEELAYQPVTLDAHQSKTLLITSQNAADAGRVSFRAKFL